MSDYTLTASPAAGDGFEAEGLSVQPFDDVTFVCFSTWSPDSGELAQLLEKALGLAVPQVNHMSRGTAGGPRLLRARADQLVLLAESGQLEASVPTDAIPGVYRTDMSDAWTFVRISGPKTPSLFERLCSLDLESPLFQAGCVAETMISHVAVYVIRDGDTDFLLGIPRSYGAHFLRELESAAALLE